MKIRSISISDFKWICLLNQELGYEYAEEKVKERIEYILNNTKDIIFVAELKDEVIGFIHGSPYELLFSDSLINILGFVVKVECRGLGIGNSLILALENYAKENGFSGIRLVSGSDRMEAHRFYEKHGYTFRKAQKNFVKMFY